MNGHDVVSYALAVILFLLAYATRSSPVLFTVAVCAGIVNIITTSRKICLRILKYSRVITPKTDNIITYGLIIWFLVVILTVDSRGWSMVVGIITTIVYWMGWLISGANALYGGEISE